MTNQISKRIGEWVDAAIEKHGQGEHILWEFACLPQPPAGAPAFVVFLWFPSHIPNEYLNGSLQIHEPWNMDAENMDEVIEESLGNLRSARSQIVAQQSGVEVPPGHALHGGLIVPTNGAKT